MPQKPKCRHNKKSAYKCETLTSNDIFYFHNRFYSRPDKISQDNFILQNLLLKPVNRKRPRNNTRNGRTHSKQYFVTKNKTKEKVPVCLDAFCGILRIKQGRIKGVSNRFAATGQSPSENRGGNRKHYAFRSKREAVQKFIMKLQPLESHYCRGKIKHRIYLDPSLNISKLYKMYEDESMPGFSVTKSFFRKVFNTSFNIGFGSPRQDVCSDCLQLLEKIKIEQNEFEKQKLRTLYRIHKIRAKCFFDKLKEDNPDILTLSFDCQKNLPLPKVADQTAYYSRQLYIYNFTIVQGNSHSSLTKDNVFSYIWTEDMASKGANEISSCLYHCLNQIDLVGKKWIRLVADGCGGQNKNTILVGMVAKWLYDSQGIEQVEIVFPVTGHSFIPPDRVFALTEKTIRRLETIISPETYIDVMSSNATIRRAVTDIPIFDWKTACKDVLKSTQQLHFQISKTKRIIIKKTEQGKILVRGEISYRNDTCNPLAITKRGKSIAGIMPDRIEHHFNVKSEKLHDVAKLLEKHFGADWRNLPDLEYYKSVLSHNENLPTQDDDDAVNDNPEYLLEDILNFV